MSHTFKYKLLKTRKEHHCQGCTRKFEKGSELYSISGVDEGDFFNYYLCKDCDEYIGNIKDSYAYEDDFFYGCLVEDDNYRKKIEATK